MTEAVPAYGDHGRSGVYRTAGVPDSPTVAWRAGTAGPVLAAPVLVGDTLIVADLQGLVYAFDATTGAVRWRQEDFDGLEVVTAPAVWNDWVLVPRSDLVVHDRHTGKVVRTLEHGGCPTVAGNVLLVHELNAGIHALSLPSFEVLWRRSGGSYSGWMDTSPAISGGTAYAALGFEANKVHSGLTAFDIATGDDVFLLGDSHEPCPIAGADGADDEDADDEGPEDWVLFAGGHPVVAEGMVWTMTDRGHEDDGLHIYDLPWSSAELVGLDPVTGQQPWSYALDPRLESMTSGAVAVSDGIVYFAAYQAGEPEDDEHGEPWLHAVDIASCELRWRSRLPGDGTGSPVVAAGVVYTATAAGRVCAFDAATGEQRWELDLGVEIMVPHSDSEDYDEDALAVLPADGILYIRTNEGIIALR